MKVPVYKRVGFWIAMSAILICVLTLTLLLIKVLGPPDLGVGSVEGIKVDYNVSEIYTRKDMNGAIIKILDQFDQFEGCKMIAFRYDSDKCNSEENVIWMNKLAKEKKIDEKFSECIMFYSDFKTPKDVKSDSGLEPDKKYENYQWYLARNLTGEWYLLTWGQDL